jgi:acylphosphatase
MRAVRVIVRGRVHGVGFRAFVEAEALSRGLSGWVRNRRDGTVEAVLSGDDEAVRAGLAALRQGPPASRVSGLDVQAEMGDVSGEFEVRPTV